MRIENDIESKRLRRLRDPQSRALRRCLDIAGFADLLDGVGDGDHGHGSTGAAGRVDRTRNQRCRDERARGVVDQNDVGLLARKRLKSGEHRGLARRAAIGRLCMAQPAHGVIEHRGIVGIDNRLHREQLRMAAECLHRPVDHRLAADLSILFGTSRAGAKSAPGCDKDGCGAVRSGHRDSMKGNSGL